jgi:hypothetical protein
MIINDLFNNKKTAVAEGSLEEVDRRGFLKGVGAAAVAGAAGSAVAQNKKFTPEQLQYIDDGLRHYHWLKSFGGDTKPWGLRVKRALDKISKLPGGKELLVSRWDIIRREDTNSLEYARLSGAEPLRNLESIVEFDESVEQGMAENMADDMAAMAQKKFPTAYISKNGQEVQKPENWGKKYVPPAAAPADLEKQQRDLTAKYPNIDELVRRAELNRDPDYEMADGQAYYTARDAEQNYLKLKQIQRVIQGLNESLNRSHLP